MSDSSLDTPVFLTRRALLILNKNSRSGTMGLSQVIAGLKGFGIDPIHNDCSTGDELGPIICRASTKVDMVVIGGGDGTLNAAASALVKARLPVGILPLGTANDLARTLHIPTDLDAALKIIAAGNVRPIDVGMVNDAMFFNVASLGMSADLAQNLTRDLKARFGKIGYALAALGVLVRAKPFRAEIVQDAKTIRSFTLQIAVGNGRYYGGGNVVEKDASIVDASLDLYSLEFLNAWRIVLMLRSFRAGEHGNLDKVLRLRGGKFSIRTRRPRPINADGEIVTHTPANFQVLPKAIDVFVPDTIPNQE